ncbi:heat-inducible transcriptional repressor [Mariprofundus micogutta]|uniref:Heat-inducible transcription repressor HrcA n=1 Tax=Mariprofundus micogutta TaxID=1921010 RepID=A0A1L8CJX3_9PROT|nr:heat-inducible transcriptional repressor HrcA [Mariprofundus micogutta]GAV19213.1 heat-inducible transcriptional repressor [Mariprofundus micogutta]
MKDRHEHILGEVVRAYLGTGQPVGSRKLADQGELGLSPASIRNVMAELERQGMLASPHTSAGRVPTDTGLRYFVDTLMAVDSNINQTLEQKVAGHLSDAPGRNALLKRATDELASLTHFAGMVWVREQGFDRINRIELVPVSSEKVLAVIVTDVGEVQNRLIARPEESSEAQLHEISQRLNELLSGCNLEEVRVRLQHEMDSDRLKVRHLLEDLKRWADAPTEGQSDMFVSGQGQLLEMPEFAVVDTIRSLMTAIEEKEQLLHLVKQVESEESGVKVFIGSEHALVNMEQISVVLSRYEGPSNIVGTLGVIGPRRMHYERVMPIVDCTAKWVSKMLGGKL